MWRENFLIVFGDLKFDVPVELIVDQCSATILILIEWIFLKKKATTREQAHHYLAVLLGIQSKFGILRSDPDQPE